MSSSALAAGLLLLWSGAAHAGRNNGGAIIVHANDAYEYCRATACAPSVGLPASCGEASTSTSRHLGTVVWLLAAFHESAEPAVTAVYFGIDYDLANLDPDSAFRPCTNDVIGNPPVEIYDSGWPLTGFGCTVGWAEPIIDRVFPFYVFRIDGGTAGSYFGAAANPTGGYAAFVDDHRPPITDDCARFGVVRWHQPGANDCPAPPLPGACCLPDASCTIVAYQDVCEESHGIYQGDGTTCEMPCGACCYWLADTRRRCVVTTEADCYDDARWDNIKIEYYGLMIGSFWSGAGLPCSDDPMGPGWWCRHPYEWERDYGACCLANGGCVYAVESECRYFGRAFLGAGEVCDLGACAELRSGACCFEDGTCVTLPGNECSAAFMGVGSTCDPSPCSLPHVRSISWGKLKALSR
ncbi:MAG: hypothetical protein FJY88_03510 [Candidatus Eisenbacteria bacterium]|nr:hypothetical protein [Candidatus Eisenbacteria bacterium]